MSSVTQVAFQISDETLAALDSVATTSSQSRAEVLRTAVQEFLSRRREEQIDAHFIAGYAAVPPGAEEAAWAETSLDGLRAADLDW